MSGWTSGGTPTAEVPVPPAAEDAASTLHGEGRAQTLLLVNLNRLFSALLGMFAAHAMFNKVRPTV
jgi:hypothetical protein